MKYKYSKNVLKTKANYFLLQESEIFADRLLTAIFVKLRVEISMVCLAAVTTQQNGCGHVVLKICGMRI